MLGCFCETTHARNGFVGNIVTEWVVEGGVVVVWGDMSDCSRLKKHTVHVLKFAHGVAMSVCALVV